MINKYLIAGLLALSPALSNAFSLTLITGAISLSDSEKDGMLKAEAAEFKASSGKNVGELLKDLFERAEVSNDKQGQEKVVELLLQ